MVAGGNAAHQPLGRELERAEVDGDGGGLGDGLALHVEERGGGVEPFLHDGRGRALEERQLHLVGDGVQAVAQDLEEDRDRSRRGSWRVSGFSGCPRPPPRRRRPGGMTVVVSGCSTIAGPARRAPTGRRARSKIGRGHEAARGEVGAAARRPARRPGVPRRARGRSQHRRGQRIGVDRAEVDELHRLHAAGVAVDALVHGVERVGDGREMLGRHRAPRSATSSS